MKIIFSALQKHLVLPALFLLSLYPARLLAGGWDVRFEVGSYPEQNTLFGLEVTRVFDLSQDLELGLGGVLRSDFSDTLDPGAVARLKYWLTEHIAVGAAGELGYMYHQSTSNPNSYSYFIVGPLLGLLYKPLFVQWEPGVMYYQSTSQLVPWRFVFGLVL